MQTAMFEWNGAEYEVEFNPDNKPSVITLQDGTLLTKICWRKEGDFPWEIMLCEKAVIATAREKPKSD